MLCPRPTERANSPVAGPSIAPEARPSTAVASAVRRGGKRGRGRPPRQPSLELLWDSVAFSTICVYTFVLSAPLYLLLFYK